MVFVKRYDPSSNTPATGRATPGPNPWRSSNAARTFICPLKGPIDIENDPDVVKQLVVNYLPDLEICFLL